MKVLIVFNHPAPYKVHIFNELCKYVDLTVIFERNKAKDRPDAFYAGNKYNFNAITLTDCYFGNEGSFSSKVKQYIKDHHQEYDYIVMNGYSHVAEMKAISYMKTKHIPFILLINGGVIHAKESFIRRYIKKKYISAAKYYISPSEESDDYLVYYGATKESIYRYPYSNIAASDILSKNPDKESLRKQYDLPLDKKIYVYAGQFIERKNNMQLLSLFKDRPNDCLLMIGSGKDQNKYESYIKQNNMSNVIILPFMAKEELFSVIQACDVFVTLSKEDIYGHTVIEGMANGLPVIASNKINAALEFIKDDYNGYIVNLDNNENIQKVLDDALSITSDGPLETAKKLTFESCGKRIAEIIEGLK